MNRIATHQNFLIVSQLGNLKLTNSESTYFPRNSRIMRQVLKA